MKRLLCIALLFSALSAEAGWWPAFSPNRITLQAGESYTLTVHKRWSGLSFFDFNGWRFGGDNDRVALVSGGVAKEESTGEVRIEALEPGTVKVYELTPQGRLSGGPYAVITVTEARPALEVHVGGPLTVRVGRSATYTAISSDSNATFHWYRGNLGDTRFPYATGPEMQYTPESRGESKFWVQVTTPRGLATSAFTVTELDPVEQQPRHRSVRH